MTTRILFVDDEQSILDGLRNLMRKNRKKWDMVFVASGQEGLAELRKQPFRVVVSDMRMPGMDGATFLAKVRDEFPQAARLILSGHADRESVMRCVPVAHQFLSKPCDPDALQRVIERVCVLQDATEPECLRALVTSLERVPTPPALFFDISKKLADPDCSLDEVGALVQQDPAMSAKLLQLVNSAYFGVGQPVTSVKRAVAYLGAETLRSLVVAQHVASSLEHARLPAAVRRAFDSIQHSSLAVARLAQAIVGAGPLSSEAFTVGLLHDLGRLVAATAWPQDFEKVLNRTSGDVFTAEREVFGFT
ncbi:MAG: HDOD domain-containing protein, partial [Deltaproteobacteria bacterium]|nr:HDOD domain-containing protein [Deltaproteobacteria bacterium]